MSGFLAAALPAVIGAGASIFGNRQASRAANRGAEAVRTQLGPIPAHGTAAYNPYISAGRGLDPLMADKYGGYLAGEPVAEYGQMASDPTGLISALMEKYKESPLFKRRREQALSAARASAAQGGYAGTQYDQERQMELADTLAEGGMQQWLDNVLGVQTRGIVGRQGLADKGLSGLESITRRGYEASSNLADYLAGAAGQRATLEGGLQASRGAQSQALLNALIGAGAQGYGAYQGRQAAEALGGGGSGGGAPNSFIWRSNTPNLNYNFLGRR